MREPTQEEWDKALKMVEKYREPAEAMVSELLDACRVEDALTGSRVTMRLHQANDIRLLMMVLGGLSARVVVAERLARQAHGPLVEPLSDEDISDSEPWATSALDQMKAAVAAGDFRTFAATAVDSQIKALIQDRQTFGAEDVDLGHVMRSMLMVDQQTLALVAAEAVMRLLTIYEGD